MRRFLSLCLALTGTSALADVQLHDNGTTINGNSGGNPVSTIFAPNNVFGYGAQIDGNNRLADDFTPASDSTLTSVRLFAYQGNAASFTFTSANIEIRVGNDVNTAAVIYSGPSLAVTNEGFVGYRVASGALNNTTRPIYRVGVDVPDLNLVAGQRYWLVWALDGSLANGPFVPQVMSGNDPLAGNGQVSLGFNAFAPVTWGANSTSELPFEIWGQPSPTGYANKLIAVDSSRVVYSINPATGAKTQIGNLTSNVGTSAGLAFDRQTASLYVTSTGNDALYKVSLVDYTSTLIGPYGDTNIVMHGLEFDSRAGKLYGASQHNGGLYEINTQTGQATLLGTTGLSGFLNLVDIGNSRMYCTSSGTDSFYSIDTNNALTNLIGTLSGPTNPNGLAYDSLRDRIFLVDNTTDNFYSINRSTGASSLIGSTGAGNLLGLAFLGPRMEATVRRGELFEGDAVSLHALDGDRLSLFNDPESLAAMLDVSCSGHVTNGTKATVSFVSSVGRPGVSMSLRMRNSQTGVYDLILGSVAPTTDSLSTVVINNPNYVNSAGVANLRFTWVVVNDEDAAQDGWLHSLDFVSVFAE